MKMMHVKGDTFCIDTGMTYIPFYKKSDEEIIMFDTGLAVGEREGIEKLIDDNIKFYKDRAASINEVINGNMTMEDILKASIKHFYI